MPRLSLLKCLALATLAAGCLVVGAPVGSALMQHVGYDPLGMSLHAQTAPVAGATTTTTATDPVNANRPVTQPAAQPQRSLTYTDNVLDEPYSRSLPLVPGAAAVTTPPERVMVACTTAGVAVLTLPDGSTPSTAVGTAPQTLNLRAVGVVSAPTGCVFTGLRR